MVTLLDVSAVAGHHTMLAALLFEYCLRFSIHEKPVPIIYISSVKLSKHCKNSRKSVGNLRISLVLIQNYQYS